MERRARFIAPLMLVGVAGFSACSTANDAGDSSNAKNPTNASIAAVRQVKAFAVALDRASAPLKSTRGWIAATRTPNAGWSSHLVASLPTQADGVTHVGRDNRDDEWIDVKPLGVKPVEGRPSGNAVVYADALESTDLVEMLGDTNVEELRVLHDERAPTVARYEIRRGRGLKELRLSDNRVQAVDDTGHVRFESGEVYAVDANGVRRDLQLSLAREGEHDVLTASLDASGLAFPIVVDPAWATVRSMKSARREAIAAELSTGKIVVAGGATFAGPLDVVEQYDPIADLWSDLPPMIYKRSASGNFRPDDIPSKIVAGPNGTFLISGGITTDGTTPPNEWFSGTAWAAQAADPEKRTGQEQWPLPGGKLLNVGGSSLSAPKTCTVAGFNTTECAGTMYMQCGSYPTQGTGLTCRDSMTAVPIKTVSIYDVGTNTWTAAGSTAGYLHSRVNRREFPGVALMHLVDEGVNAGKYLVVYNSVTGDNAKTPLKVVTQFFDPATLTWSAALPDMPGTSATDPVKLRTDFGFIKLPSAKRLFVGGLAAFGADARDFRSMVTSFTLDISTATPSWETTGSLRCARTSFATVLEGGKVRAVMGSVTPFTDPLTGPQYCNEELYNPATDSWEVTRQSGSSGGGSPLDGASCGNSCQLTTFPNGMYLWSSPGAASSSFMSSLKLVDFRWNRFFDASASPTAGSSSSSGTAYALTAAGKMLAAGGQSSTGIFATAALWTQMPDGTACGGTSPFGGGAGATADCFGGFCVTDRTVSGTVLVCGSRPGALCANETHCANDSGTIGCIKTPSTATKGTCEYGAACTTGANCAAGQACVTSSSSGSATGKSCSIYCTDDSECNASKPKCVADYRNALGKKVCSEDAKPLCSDTATVCPTMYGYGVVPETCVSGKCEPTAACTTAADCPTGLACRDYGQTFSPDAGVGQIGKRCSYVCDASGSCAAGTTCSGGSNASNMSPTPPCVASTTPDAGASTDAGGTGGSDSATSGFDTATGSDTSAAATDSAASTADTEPSTDTAPSPDGAATSDTATSDTAPSPDAAATPDTATSAIDSAANDSSAAADTNVVEDTSGSTPDSGETDTGEVLLEDAGAVTPSEAEASSCGCSTPGDSRSGATASFLGIALAGIVIARRRRD